MTKFSNIYINILYYELNQELKKSYYISLSPLPPESQLFLSRYYLSTICPTQIGKDEG